MFKKIHSKKGFTLAELLIVVAIIAVLTAIAIPVFSAQLEKARQATDLANLRSAYAEASAEALTDEDGIGEADTPKMTMNNSSWDKVGSVPEWLTTANAAAGFVPTKGTAATVTVNSSTGAVTIANKS